MSRDQSELAELHGLDQLSLTDVDRLVPVVKTDNEGRYAEVVMPWDFADQADVMNQCLGVGSKGRSDGGLAGMVEVGERLICGEKKLIWSLHGVNDVAIAKTRKELAKSVQDMQDYSKRMPTEKELAGMRDMVKYKLEKENDGNPVDEERVDAVLKDVLQRKKAELDRQKGSLQWSASGSGKK